MNRQVTIVMYHYVRDLKHSRFPGIKGLSVERFRNQLDYIQSHYTPITVEALIDALNSGQAVPPNSILLTFDDGYIDHFANVYPLLEERKIQGCFFPPAQAICEHKVLDVNKIHFILASVTDKDLLLKRLFSRLDEMRSMYDLKSNESYIHDLREVPRFDSREVVLFKRLLQRELPPPVRAKIVQDLFTEYVSADELAFACELYMSTDQIECLRRQGMHVGSHGHSHVWLNHLTPTEQATEVDLSIEFLQGLGVSPTDWTICYPYGGFDESLLQILRSRHCQLGFSVEARIAALDTDDRLALPRIDTNDLPS